MQTLITGRHVEITNGLKTYAEQKAARLPRYYDRVQNVEIIVEKEADQFAVEMIVNAAGTAPFVAKISSEDIFGCIDLLVDKLERQLTKHKERFRNRKHLAKKLEPNEEAP